jgi:hypothetical protein
VDIEDLEGLALLPYQEKGIDPEDPPPVFDLIRAWLGVSVERPTVLAGKLATSFVIDGHDAIAVKSRLPIEYAHFYAAHELAHVILRRVRAIAPEDEAAADYLGAALMMPRAFVRAVFRRDGYSPIALAESIVCTQTASALRLGEVLRVPMAAISPALVRVRGPESWVWPDEEIVRRWARRPRPGVTKKRLTDQRGRVALVIEEDVA